jgi:hypothetical protein
MVVYYPYLKTDINASKRLIVVVNDQPLQWEGARPQTLEALLAEWRVDTTRFAAPCLLRKFDEAGVYELARSR